MSDCDGVCKCKEEKKEEVTFDRLAELDRFLDGNTIRKQFNDVDMLVSPIVRKGKGETVLQFSGWAIQLYSDGTWIVTDTSGG